MKNVVLNLEQGIASDVIEVYINDKEQPDNHVASFSLEDDDQLNITWGDEGNSASLWIPLDRLRRLITQQAQPSTPKTPRKKAHSGKRGKHPRTPEWRAKQSLAMKAAWEKRKEPERVSA
jgi:hypothetical protein